MNPTIVKFGYPASLVHELEHWVILLRPAQVTLGSLVLVLPSGALLLAAHADELARNPAMQIKLALLLVAAANALVLHRSRSRPTSGDTATDKRRHVPAAVLSLLTWVGVIAAGRLIAYV